MRIFIGLLLLAVSVGFSSAVLCNCDNGLRPVCASDGVTYQNECWMNCKDTNNILRDFNRITKTFPGYCPDQQCFCLPDNKRVCGSNGITFDNLCEFNCDDERRTQLSLEHLTSYPDACILFNCVDNLNPVCGTDGKTYKNDCYRKFANAKLQAQFPGSTAIDPLHTGPCPTEKCNCQPDPIEVCGSDGVTYPNKCQLECVNRKQVILNSPAQKVTLDYNGKCVICNCGPPPYAPVCVNGKTYDNICKVTCENKKRNLRGLISLVPSYNGKCLPCYECWNTYYNPVCASNKKTYFNACYVNCENKGLLASGSNKFLWIPHKGECYAECPNCDQSPPYACGDDGFTYWNACWLNCVSVFNQNNGEPPIKPVKEGFCDNW